MRAFSSVNMKNTQIVFTIPLTQNLLRRAMSIIIECKLYSDDIRTIQIVLISIHERFRSLNRQSNVTNARFERPTVF